MLLDTNVISELRHPAHRRDPRVEAWVRSVSPLDFHLSALTIFEIEAGVQRMERRDERQGRMLRAWMHDAVLGIFATRILPLDGPVAIQAATWQAQAPRPDRDCFIAATAQVHRMSVVTRNVRDFAPLGVPVINPWEGPID